MIAQDRPTRNKWVSLATVLATALAIFLAYRFYQREQRRKAFAAEYAMLVGSSTPATPDDLERFYKSLPYSPEATDAWQAAFTAVRPTLRGSPIKFDGLPPRPGDSWSELPRIVQFLEQNKVALATIDAASEFQEACQYLDDFSQFYNMALRHVDGLNAVIGVLRHRLHVRTHQGDAAGAIVDLKAMIRAGETLRLEPMFVSQLVRRHLLRRNLEALQNILAVGRFSDEQLGQLQAELVAIDLDGGMELGTLGEIVWGLKVFRDPAEAAAGSTPAVIHQAWTQDDPASFLLMMREFLDASRTEWPEPLERTAKYHSMSVNAAAVRAPLGGEWHSPTNMGGAMRHNLIVNTAVQTARVQAAIASLAAIRFRQATGHWPKSLVEMTPKFLEMIPTDPFTGGPLRMKQDGHRLIIYAVGVNATDDDGVEKAEANEQGHAWRRGNPDVSFEVLMEHSE